MAIGGARSSSCGSSIKAFNSTTQATGVTGSDIYRDFCGIPIGHIEIAAISRSLECC